MGKLTGKDIKTLVNAAQNHLAEMIEQEAVNQISNGDTVDIGVQIRMEPDEYAAEKTQEVTQCIMICYTIGGVRYCFKYCY